MMVPLFRYLLYSLTANVSARTIRRLSIAQSIQRMCSKALQLGTEPAPH